MSSRSDSLLYKQLIHRVIDYVYPLYGSATCSDDWKLANAAIQAPCELRITHNIMLMTDSLGFGNCIIRRLYISTN